MAEILTTLALRPGAHVIDRDDRRRVEHVVDQVTHPEQGVWDVVYRDGQHVRVGARHGWLDVTP